MKKVLILAAFATIISIPAFAQSFDPDAGTGNACPTRCLHGVCRRVCAGARHL